MIPFVPLTSDELADIAAERIAKERDAFARRVVAIRGLTPVEVIKRGAAFAEGYEWARSLLLASALGEPLPSYPGAVRGCSETGETKP